jgi:hypothetical protein
VNDLLFEGKTADFYIGKTHIGFHSFSRELFFAFFLLKLLSIFAINFSAGEQS